MKNIYKQIYDKIKKYETIVIARHVGADPDALGSQLGLRDSIRETFKNKKVYAVGYPASKFKYIGNLDKTEDVDFSEALLIVTDTPDIKRIDGANLEDFKEVIKIDHHPEVDKFGDLTLIDDTSSSAAQLVTELIFNTKLVLNKEIAEKLYLGIVADTNRFLFYYTTPKTFRLVADLIEKTNIDITDLYNNLYMRSLKETKFQGFIADNFTVTENGFAHIKITKDMLKKYDVDPATAGNMVNNFNYIENVYVWAVFTEDERNGNIRASIRSRGPIINDVASLFNGGGHIYASGARLNDFSHTDKLIEKLDERCENYIKEII